jgi:hypothetical protein
MLIINLNFYNPVHSNIEISMLNRFSKQEHAAEIYENQPIGTYVKHLEARSTSSLFFEIIDGNKDDMFFINPSTGVIITKRQLDYELNKFYNLSVEATNMVSKRICFFYVLKEEEEEGMVPQNFSIYGAAEYYVAVCGTLKN